MSATLLLHAGGWTATRADLAAVPVPEETGSYFPVPHDRFVEEVSLHVPRFGLRIEREEYALARDGRQMFGVLTCRNGTPAQDHGLAIGLRNSYDRSIAVGLVAGTRVFCCDNLAFTGEAGMHRKHTANVFRDLPDLIYRMLGKVKSLEERQETEIALMKGYGLSRAQAHHLMVEAVRGKVVPASDLPRVIHRWEKPEHPEFAARTAWSLFNAFTGLLGRKSPRVQMDATLRLGKVFRGLVHS